MIIRRIENLDPETLAQLVGMGIDYTGDMANASGRGAIVRAYGDQWGQHVDIITEDGRRMDRTPVCMLATPDMRQGCLHRFIMTGPMHGAPYLAQLEAAAILRTQNLRAAEQAARENLERSEAARVITDPPLFYWNGVRDAKGAELQGCHYSGGSMRNFPDGTITVYASGYSSFSAKVRGCFRVENDTDYQTDYFDKDSIRVIPAHPLYAAVKAAMEAQDAHRDRMSAKRAARRQR